MQNQVNGDGDAEIRIKERPRNRVANGIASCSSFKRFFDLRHLVSAVSSVGLGHNLQLNCLIGVLI